MLIKRAPFAFVRKKIKISLLIVAMCGFIAALLPVPVLANGGQHNRQKCEEETLRVKLAPEDTQTYKLVGWLCWEGHLPGKTVHVLVSGFTYDHNYWDFPHGSGKYSYVDALTDQGYATFNIDRVGVGKSDRPIDPGKVTIPAEAYVSRQIVQALRDGNINKTKFRKVIGVGHSMGAAIWMVAAATYPENAGVDGFILADFLHQTNPAVQGELQAARHRAQEDPKFDDLNLPEGYYTTKPGLRHLYYNSDFADPRVIQADEKLKQTATIGEILSLGPARDPIYSQAITVPVIVVAGQKDSLFCSESVAGLSCANKEAVAAREASSYTNAACMDTYVLPSAGHDTNLHYNAQKWFKEAAKWSDRRIGESVWRSPDDAC